MKTSAVPGVVVRTGSRSRVRGVLLGVESSLTRLVHRVRPVLLAGSVLAVPTVLTVPTAEAQIRGVVVEDPRVGARAPGLVLPYVTSGGVAASSYDLGAELGRVVVLAFCPRLADPTCTAAWRSWAAGGLGGGVSLVGVSGDPAGVAVEFARAERVASRLLTDDRLVASRRWMAAREGRVAVFVIGREGVVAYRDLQFFPSDPAAVAALRAAIDAAGGRRGGS